MELDLLKDVNSIYNKTIHELVEILINSQKPMTEEERIEILKELFTEEN